jgi:hypothetical protein
MLEFAEAGSGELAAPGCKVMEGGIASILPAFLIVAVGFEQNSTPCGLRVACSCRRTRGSSRVGT